MSFADTAAGWSAFQRIAEACIHGRDVDAFAWLAPNQSCPTSHINHGDEE